METPDATPANGWDAAATPDAGAPTTGSQPAPYMQATQGEDTPQPAPAATENPAPPAAIAPAAAPAAYEQPPVVITPIKRSGILGMVDNIADALTGRTRPVLGKDQQGNTYVQHQVLGRGEQWARIGAEAVAGAAKGFAAGRGNNLGAAAGAGFDQGAKMQEQGQQQEKDLTAEARQQNIDNANNQMLQQTRADQAWKSARLKVKAGQDDVDFEQKQIDRLVNQGGRVLGTAAHPGDIGNILKVEPDVMKRMIVDHQLELRTAHNEDGTVAGITAILMPKGHRDQVVPAGATGHHWNPVSGKLEEFKYSDPQTQGSIDDNETAAGNAQMKFKSDQVEQELKQQEALTAKERARVVPSEILKNNAQAAHAFAEATKAAKDGQLTKDDPQVAQLGEAIARGGISIDQIPGFSKNKTAIEAYLAEHHPNLDQKSVMMTGEERKRGDLSRNAIHNLDLIDKTLARRPDLIGVVQGRLSEGKKISGTNDEDLSTINTALDNYGLASTGAHGIRAVQARVDAREALLNDFKNGPKAIKASIRTAKGSLQDLAKAGLPRGIDGSDYVYKAQPAAPAAPGSARPAAAAPAAAGVPAGKIPGYDAQGKLVGYADDDKGTNFHKLGAS